MTKTDLKKVSFRLPMPLSRKLDLLIESSGLSRSELVEIALKALVRQVKSRGGAVLSPCPSYLAADEVARVRALVEQREKSRRGDAE